MKFLRNAWYAAAWDEEVTDQPLGRVFLETPVVLYRLHDGSVAALADTCPHRFAPLHKGSRHGDVIACPYHGLQFGPDGRCVHNPHGAIPDRADIRRFETAERYGVIWIWLGEQPADPASLPVIPEKELPGHVWVGGLILVAAHYQLVVDNLMDLTHVEFMHPMLANPGSAATTQYAVELAGDTVISSYNVPLSAPSMVFRMMVPDLPDQIRLLARMRYSAPANLVLTTLILPVNGDPENPLVSGPTTHFLTPETANSTHYFWTAARNVQIENEDLSNMMRAGTEHAFKSEDEPMIAAVHRRMSLPDGPGLQPLMFRTDGGAVQAQRMLQRRIEAEQGLGIDAS